MQTFPVKNLVIWRYIVLKEASMDHSHQLFLCSQPHVSDEHDALRDSVHAPSCHSFLGFPVALAQHKISNGQIHSFCFVFFFSPFGFAAKIFVSTICYV